MSYANIWKNLKKHLKHLKWRLIHIKSFPLEIFWFFIQITYVYKQSLVPFQKTFNSNSYKNVKKTIVYRYHSSRLLKDNGLSMMVTKILFIKNLQLAFCDILSVSIINFIDECLFVISILTIISRKNHDKESNLNRDGRDNERFCYVKVVNDLLLDHLRNPLCSRVHWLNFDSNQDDIEDCNFSSTTWPSYSLLT